MARGPGGEEPSAQRVKQTISPLTKNEVERNQVCPGARAPIAYRFKPAAADRLWLTPFTPHGSKMSGSARARARAGR